MDVIINQDTCIGCGRCTEICPKAFRLNTDSMKAEAIPSDDLECADKAANQCPTDSITVHNN
jgi:ferredoxin